MRRLLWTLPLALAACVTMHGPTWFNVTTFEIERNIETDLGGVLAMFEGLDVRRPQVDLMPASNRLQLTWTARMPGVVAQETFGSPLTIAIAVSGTPKLSERGDGVVLHEVVVEDVRISGVPRLFSFGLSQLTDRTGATLPDIPLFALASERLRRGDVAYRATGVEVTYEGLRVNIEPR